ncbi:N-6 DNA methylase [Flavobacterium sp. TAB 87]|uniref:N-6 DNA methylase n=1 Tax=Flavobacterium sp. TAB 87 TaxID=1729581 RepID=UPI00076C1DAC|nr:N-6 DNA methylase [Flavobacterium sp. TAB 87]KVV16022.1 putative type I restriction enzymeP M protein [Flavobacterium sp. TAB 87]
MAKVVYSNPVEVISFKIFGIFDAFRTNPKLSHLEDSVPVVLLLVSLYKDGVICEKTFTNNFSLSDLKTLIFESNLDKETKDTYLLIFDVLSDSLSKVFSQPLGYLNFHLFQNGKEMLSENFSNVIDDIIYKISKSQGRHAGEFIQPLELTRLMCGLANLSMNSKVFNPFAGLASFDIYLNKNQEFFGQELNKKTWALGALRLMAYGKRVSSEYICEDSILNWPKNTEKFDLIISNPPYGVRFGNNYKGVEHEFRTIEQFLIKNGVDSLSENGKLIVLLPQGFLFRGMQEERLRTLLIEEDLIDTIISLPGGLLLNTGIPLIILVLDRNKKLPGRVKFVDAKNFVNLKGPREKVLNDQELLSQIMDTSIIDYSDNQNVVNEPSETYNSTSSAKINYLVRLVDNSQIKENDYNLSVTRYFQEHIEGVKLRDIIEPYRGLRGNLPETGKLIRIRDLKDDNVNFLLDDKAVEETELNRHMIHQIDESCLLLAIRWKTLKPTFFEYKGSPIFKSQDIFSAKIKQVKIDEVNIAYLINELQSEYVQKQLDSYRLGATIPFIRQVDLLNVVIKLPSLEEQHAKVSGIIELSSKLKELEVEKENLLKGIKKEETESSTSLSHILGKPLLSIGSSLEIIQNTLSKVYPEWKDLLISETKQFYMIDAFESISKNVKYIQELADENTALVSVYSFNLIEINFLKFLSEFVKNEKKSLKNNIDIKLDIHEDIKEQMNNKVFVFGNEQKLKIVLINLIDNAKNHAFIEPDMENKINIEILPFTRNEREAYLLNYDINGRKSYVEIRISNTGKPFPKDFTLEDYTRKNFAVGKTRNRGLGGYEVNEIIKAHNEGKKALNISSSEDDKKYSSTVSFLIPII